MSDTYAPTRSLGRTSSGRGGAVAKVVNLAGHALVVGLVAIAGPALVAAWAGTPFGTGDLSTTDFMTALVGFILASGVVVGIAKLRAGRRGGR